MSPMFGVTDVSAFSWYLASERLVRGRDVAVSVEESGDRDLPMSIKRLMPLLLLLSAVLLPGYRPHEEAAIAKICASNLRAIEYALAVMASSTRIAGNGEVVSQYPVLPGSDLRHWPECKLFREVTSGAREYTVVASAGRFLARCPYHFTVNDLRFGPDLERDPIAGPLVEKAKERMRHSFYVAVLVANVVVWYAPGLLLLLSFSLAGAGFPAWLFGLYQAAVRVLSVVAVVAVVPANVAASTPQMAHAANITAMFALGNLGLLMVAPVGKQESAPRAG